MKERIKLVRTSAHLTQKEFAERLRIKQNTVASYEMGRIGISDNVLFSICREFNINENWLRTGDGKMYSPISPEDRFAKNVGKIQRTDNETIIKWVNAIAETSPEALTQIESFLKKLLDIE